MLFKPLRQMKQVSLWYNYSGDKMNSINALNKAQKEAVLTEAQHVRIIAGAGSGKTRVLTTRITHLIQDKGIAPYRICAITFTNKAANEMKDRMESMLPQAVSVHTSTIHALCVRIIREEYEALDLVRNFSILDTADQNSLMKEAYNKFEYDRKELTIREVLNYISSNKIAKVSVKNAEILANGNFMEEKKARLYKYYQERLKQLMALDFDDLLIKVDDLLKENEYVRNKWQSKFQVILVDEFQDVDVIQYGIIQSLAGNDNALYVVGDPDQTIYTWRGADVDFITRFDRVYPDAVTITLNQNYRSTQHILNSANALINYNTDRPDKELFANKESDFQVEYASLGDQDDESYWIVSKILELKQAGGSYLDTAVLYRSNYLSRSLEKILMARQIPYVIYGGLRFYDQMEIKDLMSHLKMITHADDLSLRRSVISPRRGIGEKTLDNYFIRSIEDESSIYEVMLFDVQHHQASKRVKDYVEMIENFKEVSKTLSIADLIDYVIIHSGLQSHFIKIDEEVRIESMRELMSDATYFVDNYEDASLADYIQMVSLYGDKGEVVEGDYLRLMTVHAAKGLEFENVIIMGLSDNIFPNRNSVQEGLSGLQEERRLMYVAITRAKERLFLTNNSGFNFIMGSYLRESRFIKEMELEKKKVKPEILAVDTRSAIHEFEAEMRPKTRFKKADIIIHEAFGEGIVIAVEDSKLRIAFNFPHGMKVIDRSYKGIRLKGDLS